MQPTTVLEESLGCFHALALALLARAQALIRDDATVGQCSGSKLARLKALLDFKLYQSPRVRRQKEPNTLSDFRPMRVAFADNDATFMHVPATQVGRTGRADGPLCGTEM